MFFVTVCVQVLYFYVHFIELDNFILLQIVTIISSANVIGFKSETYSNSCIHSYPLPNSNKVVYASAALGIVMDIETNR